MWWWDQSVDNQIQALMQALMYEEGLDKID
jgi:hypothetical protein